MKALPTKKEKFVGENCLKRIVEVNFQIVVVSL